MTSLYLSHQKKPRLSSRLQERSQSYQSELAGACKPLLMDQLGIFVFCGSRLLQKGC